MRQESYKMGVRTVMESRFKITEYQSYMNYSYIGRPARFVSATAIRTHRRIKAKEGTIVSVEKGAKWVW